MQIFIISEVSRKGVEGGSGSYNYQTANMVGFKKFLEYLNHLFTD